MAFHCLLFHFSKLSTPCCKHYLQFDLVFRQVNIIDSIKNLTQHCGSSVDSVKATLVPCLHPLHSADHTGMESGPMQIQTAKTCLTCKRCFRVTSLQSSNEIKFTSIGWHHLSFPYCVIFYPVELLRKTTFTAKYYLSCILFLILLQQ